MADSKESVCWLGSCPSLRMRNGRFNLDRIACTQSCTTLLAGVEPVQIDEGGVMGAIKFKLQGVVWFIFMVLHGRHSSIEKCFVFL